MNVTLPIRRGVSQLTLTLILIGVGCLAAVGVPSVIQRQERQRAAEAFAYLDDVVDAQRKRFLDRQDYADDLSQLDLTKTSPSAFCLGKLVVTADTWSLTLNRCGATFGYGPYSLTFTEQGWDRVNSSIPREILPDDVLDDWDSEDWLRDDQAETQP